MGLFFGPDASLNIGGSFIASTASSLNFTDGTQFSATAPQATPLLTVSVPIGLQFGGTAASILNQSQATNSISENVALQGLQVQPGKTLALVGGDVSLEGGIVSTEGGRIELGSVAGNNLVSLTPTNQGWTLGYEGIQNFQDIRLTQVAVVASFTTSDRGGDIQVQGRRVTLSESQITSVSLAEGQAGNLSVSASESVELVRTIATPTGPAPSGLFTQVQPQATGNGGNLTVETGRFTALNGATVSANTLGAGRAGDLRITASESVELVGTSPGGEFPGGLFAQVGGTGNAETLTIETGQLIVKNGAQVSADTFGAGRAADVSVRALESVELIGTAPDNITPSGIFAQVGGLETGDIVTGNAGNLTIVTERLTALDGAQISTAARTGGEGGTVTINASDSVLLSGTAPKADLIIGSSGIFVSAERGATRNAGELNLTTGQLTVEDGAKISADNFGTGEGGTATLNVRQLIIRDGGQVRAGSFGEGPGGTLTVNDAESVEVSGTGTIVSNSVNSRLFTEARSSGDAGDLIIKTENLNVRDGADVTVSSTGTGMAGEAGELIVEADSIELDNNAALRATTLSGQGGDIRLEDLDLLLLRRNSSISTRAGNEETGGTGGNITIDTNNLIAQENSDIDADAFGGSGGEVRINAQAVFGTEGREERSELTNDITASSNLGPQFSGIVEINTPEVDPSQGIVALPAEVIDASELIAQGCNAGEEDTESKFTITGRGGLPPNPSETLSSDAVWEDSRLPSVNIKDNADTVTTTQLSNPDQVALLPATGWVFNKKGEVTLIAQAPNATPDNLRSNPTTCRVR